MKILIGADLVPTKCNFDLFEKSDIDALIGQELKCILKSADFRIFNLEFPLTDIDSPIIKCGPARRAQKSSINGIKALNVDLFTLANNHILDQGENGLRDTVKLLDENNIAYFGAGDNLEIASKPYVFELDNKKIGVYACAEHEFSIATENKCGANPYDDFESNKAVKELKSKCDYVIVLYHGGKEHFRYPSPLLQKRCRQLALSGADLILTQHSHCIGCFEKFENTTILYGQGNFLFRSRDNECWYTGLLVEISDDFKVNFIPVEKTDVGVKLATGDSGEKILNAFNERSIEILDSGFVQKKYAEYSLKNIEEYLARLSGVTGRFWFKVLNKLTKQKFTKFYVKRRYSLKKIYSLINCFDCESHSELILEGLKNYANKRG